MYLKSISLKGFKSFPDRTRLEFGPGVSVIVGPNGSGKSNVTDAVLWALGEQSPGAVRGQSMQDVIFGGAPGRQAARSAEVELVLDDSEGRLGLGTPEVSIVRRLDRGGEGEYRLAGARCRLVDVLEVLSDTGLGKEMHSVISQGRVEAIVTSKPRDRRMLIEEAAGLGKHRKRRRRAQLKLERTQDNLDRALDVEREARSRLRPLKRQAEAAELHARLERQTLEAQWELVRERVRAELVALAAAEAEVAAGRERRQELERAMQRVAAEREQAEAALAARSAQREELSRRSFLAAGAADRIGYRADAVRAAERTVRERLERGRALTAQLEAEAAGDLADPATAARIAELERRLAALERDREAELAAPAGGSRERARRRAHRARPARVRDRGGTADPGRGRARASRRRARRCASASGRWRRPGGRPPGSAASWPPSTSSCAASRPPAGRAADALADELEVDPGYELALAAALDGRLGAALVDDRAGGQLAARRRRSRRRSGTRARRIAGPRHARPVRPPAPGAEPLLAHVRGDDAALRPRDAGCCTTRGCSTRSTALPAGLRRRRGHPRSGRVWSAGMRELRQASAHGEERVLEERNRRDRLIADSERAAGAEHRRARGARPRRRAGRRAASVTCEAAVAADRAAVRARDEAAEHERRLAAQIERRRAAPDEGPAAAERAAAGRRAACRARRERAGRARAGPAVERIERLRAAVDAPTRRCCPRSNACSRRSRPPRTAVTDRRARFEAELAADRQAGEHVALRLRACAQQEAELQGRARAGQRRAHRERGHRAARA